MDHPQNVLPIFRHHSIVIDPKGLRYNPTNDIIFPSVIETTRLKNARARFYLYYAPHDAPGGLCLAYSDSLTGPWKEFEGNPIVGKDWPGNYSVSHVSSPHVIWNKQTEELLLYFHGENDTTRWARSGDGVHFTYGGVAIDTSIFDEISEASYARVFPMPNAGGGYVMLFMGNNKGTRRIYLARSPDGKIWQARRTPLIDPPPGCAQTGAPWYFRWKGKHYITSHGDLASAPTYEPVSDLYVSEVDEQFEGVRYVGKLLDHTSVSPTNKRQSDPCIFESDGRLFLLSAVDARLHQKIALAVADVL